MLAILAIVFSSEAQAAVDRSPAKGKRPTAPAVTIDQLSTAEKRAFQVAEALVLELDYTTRPGTTPSDTEFPYKRDTLKPKAYGLKKGSFGGQPGWTVLFEQSDTFLRRLSRLEGRAVSSRALGMAVTMDSSFQNARLHHQATLSPCRRKEAEPIAPDDTHLDNAMTISTWPSPTWTRGRRAMPAPRAREGPGRQESALR